MIKIDGSYGEGGGQILRTAVSLSCITGEPVEIDKIRASRPKPGMAMQHLKGIEAAKMITDAEVEGLQVGSTRVIFKPHEVKGGNYTIDIQTAGSVTLILQTILLPALTTNISLKVRGGTDVNWSPPIDYLRNVTLKALEEMGANISTELVARGYYPKGGGQVNITNSSSKLRGVDFGQQEQEQGHRIQGISHSSNLPPHVAQRQASAAQKTLQSKGYNSRIDTQVERYFSTGTGITLWCGYKGGSALGEKGKKAENVGEEAANNLLGELGSEGCFDQFLADQLMPCAAVASGSTIYTTSKVTMHQISNSYVLKEFFGPIIDIDEDKRKISIKGLGIL
ncbi:MAG: RNA 3'-terminal phosphate cyclase [Archaeoglobaceae archaeon]